MPADRIWIKNPLALFTANDQEAPGGLVVENGTSSKCSPPGPSPALPVNEIFDAREHVVLPGLVNTITTSTRPDPRLGPVVNEPLFNWLLTPLPGLGTAYAAGAAAGEQGGAGRAAAVRLHHGGGSPHLFPAGSRTPSTSGRGRPRMGMRAMPHPRFGR